MSTNDNTAVSRRQVVGGTGASLAVAAAAPAFAQAAAAPSAPAPQPLQDPANKYPRPPYKRQSQPWPGLRAKWTQGPTMARPATEGRAGSPGEKR